MEYRRYLMEVIKVLETDPEFRAKLEKANQADIHVSSSFIVFYSTKEI